MISSMMRLAGAVLLTALLAGTAAADDRDVCRVDSGDVAIEACNRVINSGRYSGRDLVDAYINRGQEYYLKKDYDRAISDASQAIRVDGKTAILAYGNRGNAWSVKGEMDKAISDYTRALRLDRNYTAALTGRGMEWEKKGDTKRAIADYRAALKLPQKYQDGKWAHEKARERLAELDKR
jgi:tetratricopeptide (TPR) repeat protein